MADVFVGDSSGLERVLRGGSWFWDADHARSDYRTGLVLDGRSNEKGFRLAGTPKTEP